MKATRNQRTLAAAAAVDGIGYWSGQDVRIEFHPAIPHSGIVFVRSDLPGRPRIPAVASNRIETPLRTSLRCGRAEVEMIEHVMAALSGLQVDNCEIRVDRPEMPGCDGSCLPFVAAVQEAGIVEQDAPRPAIVIRKTMRLGNEESWIEAGPGARGQNRRAIRPGLRRRQPHRATEPGDPAATEALPREPGALPNVHPGARGRCPSGQGPGQRTTFRDLLVFDNEGPIDNELRFPDECVRHKIVDMMGDLALAGCDLFGRFTAYRSGHRLNGELVRAILARHMTEQTSRRWCA